MSTSTFASASCWFKDVLRTKSLSPSNPILQSLPSPENVLESFPTIQQKNKDATEGTTATEAAKATATQAAATTTTTTTTTTNPSIPLLPKFSILQPHHLQKAAEEIRRQYDVELAQLEVRLTSVSEEGESEMEIEDNASNQVPERSALSALLLDVDRLTAPVTQLREVSDLYATLASPPDRIDDWREAADTTDSSTTRRFVEKLHQSGIVYRALVAALAESEHNHNHNYKYKHDPTTSEGTVSTPSLLVPYLKRGAHMDTDAAENGSNGNNNGGSNSISNSSSNSNIRDEQYRDDVERFRQLQDELSILNDRLDNIVSYDRASKAMRLQCMSDMYNCIGLSRIQAEMLVPSRSDASVWDLARLQHHHMVVSPRDQLIEGLFPEVAAFLQPFLPTQTKLDLEGVGAFLESKSEVANNYLSHNSAEARKSSMKARFDFKEGMRLHGVVKGLIDFCDAILGIVVVEDNAEAVPIGVEAGWSKNVRLLHLYEKPKGGVASEEEGSVDETDSKGRYLGTIYLDPFADSYWRTEDAKELVTTKLFSKQLTGQTIAPVAIMALKITPIWDDTPVPMTWKDTRDFLYQFGNALQLILTQACQKESYHQNGRMIDPAPIDTSEFLGHFLEMWIHNDGFLHRLVQLSQDEFVLEEETLKLLRHDLKKEKALEMMNTMFLSALQFTVFDEFDPRGDETLVALQERLGTQYLPKSNLPDPTDLSPLLAVFQQSGVDQTMSAYGTLWSEVLASIVYEQFKQTDLRDRDEVERLGTGIRDLFLRSGCERPHRLSEKDFENLCGMKEEPVVVTGDSLKRVYGFDQVTYDVDY
eukprot:CAMPEP_0172363032 /NCGR_PEP_ID=MMETSP1060-20121228/6500_1 /TAXON_ID=37318 /ORGANISM="Pseudo-nitzschia pungens, Strain cf. cingulata" /LENGTH=817 /DNA_ID=CAMNT_0013085679 /DNA_START=492 /DNA_END=2945 /DNA_ORIENTATION=+